MTPTPLVFLGTDRSGNHLFIKRDDLLPFSFGGNKVRIAREFFSHMQKLGKDCIIGYGNARSNLSRAIANMAAAENIPCHIISPADDDGTRTDTGNSRIVSLCGAQFHTCQKTQVAQTVEQVIDRCQAQGFSPYYIYGDKFGQGNEATPVGAYVKAYEELHAQTPAPFDYIFLPTGTGMTQAGLLSGQSICGGRETIIGISVARSAEQERTVIAKYTAAYAQLHNTPEVPMDRIHILDDYLCGGYGKYNSEICRTISRIMRTYGVPLDPTYTGKAFYGMEEYLRANNVTGKNILFLHTGGAPLFFDHMARFSASRCTDKAQLLEFLHKIDRQLPEPLSARVDLSDYADKVLQHGYVMGIAEDETLVCAALFYCNDLSTKSAYLTLLGTLPDFEGRGYAAMTLSAAEQAAADAGMTRFHLDTEHTNTKAVRFYRSHGYAEQEGGAKLHMVKELSL